MQSSCMHFTCIRDIQKSAGSLASLSRFISRLGEKALPLYRLWKKIGKFTWNDKANAALLELKEALSKAPVLTPPTPREPMLMYIAATNQCVSIVLVVQRQEEGKEHPVYYVNEVLSQSKRNYPHYQKLVYDVHMAEKKPHHYF